MLISRPFLTHKINTSLKNFRITALLGPRQCGKSTLARAVKFNQPIHYFDLEKQSDLARLSHPESTLEKLKGLVVLDEIQRQQDLFPILRVLADRKPLPARFLILGSVSPNLFRHASESLAGRVNFIYLPGFSLLEVGLNKQNELMLRGGFPESFLARNHSVSLEWRESFIQTFLERDIPQLGFGVAAVQLRRFWTMVAHHHAQLWTSTDIGASLSLSHTTIRRYLDLLTGAFALRQLQPWFENMGKRVVKAPKVYIRDSGIFHALLGIREWKELESHPKLGASWEGFALEQVVQRSGDRNVYFWATHGGAELDLLLLRQGKKWGVEFKYGDAPVMTKSMHIVQKDLKLEKLWVVYPGSQTYSVEKNVTCIGLAPFLTKFPKELAQ